MVTIEHKLELVRQFQNRFPELHVGGSIGLFLHGVDLKRSLDKSDIDLTSPIPLSFSEPLDIENAEESSNPEDFEYAFMVYPLGYEKPYTKVDISLQPGKEFDVIIHESNSYKVSKLQDIYFWKSKYAAKGIEKHIDDFIAIVTGVRPERKKDEQPAVTVSEDSIDDLPF